MTKFINCSDCPYNDNQYECGHNPCPELHELPKPECNLKVLEVVPDSYYIRFTAIDKVIREIKNSKLGTCNALMCGGKEYTFHVSRLYNFEQVLAWVRGLAK